MPQSGGKGPTEKGGAVKDGGHATLRIAAVADLHVHKVHHGQYRQMFAEMSERADVAALCGDLTNLGIPEEAEHLAADLGALRIPAVAVLGNHDHQSGRSEEVKRILEKANVTFLEDESYEIADVGFAGVKGFGGGFGSHTLGSFGEDATKHFVGEAVSECLVLENALKNLPTQRRVILLHYAPVMDTVRGEPPEIYPFLGCSRLAETIDRVGGVAAIFHGHAHHGGLRGKTAGGAPVYNCSIELLRKTAEQPYVVVEV
jgi:uncharacterized protein